MKNYIITFADGGEYSAEAENKTQAAIIATAERLLERKGYPLEIHAIHYNDEYSMNQIQVPWVVVLTPVLSYPPKIRSAPMKFNQQEINHERTL